MEQKAKEYMAGKRDRQSRGWQSSGKNWRLGESDDAPDLHQRRMEGTKGKGNAHPVAEPEVGARVGRVAGKRVLFGSHRDATRAVYGHWGRDAEVVHVELGRLERRNAIS